MRRFLRRQNRAAAHRRMRGQIIPIVAIFGSVLVAFAALGLDGSNDRAIQIKLYDSAQLAANSAANVWGKTNPTQSSLSTLASNSSTIATAQSIAALNGVPTLSGDTCTIKSGSTAQYDVVFLDKPANTTNSGTNLANCESQASGWQYALEIQIPPVGTPFNPIPAQCSPTFTCVGVTVNSKAWQYIPVAVLAGSTTNTVAGATAFDNVAVSGVTNTVSSTQTVTNDNDTSTQTAAACASSVSPPVVCWYAGASGTLHMWTGSQAATQIQKDSSKVVSGISCASSSQCYASAVNGQILSLTYGGGVGSVSTALNAGSPNFAAISCPGNGSHCLAVDVGNVSEFGSGTTWTQYAENTSNALLGVSCVSDSSCLAVGQNGTVDYFNGSSWTVQTAITGTPQMNAISCVAGTTDCWAVGNGGLIYFTNSLSAPSWTQETSNTLQNLYGISCPSTAECLAGGASGLIEHTLNAAAGAGATWYADGAGTGQDIESVTCASTSECSEAAAGGAIVQTTMPVPAVTSVAPTSGTTAGGTTVTITGSGFTGSTAVNFGATAATSFTVNSNTQITATAPSGTAGAVDITVVNPSGTSSTSSNDQYTYTSTGGFTSETSGTSNQLNSVSCPPGQTADCWAVGASNTIIATTNGGSTWSAQTATGTFNGVACPDTTHCFAVGQAGTIFATSNGGTSWGAQTSGITTNLNAVACVINAGAYDCWAVGDAGVVLATSNAGSTWTSQTSGNSSRLTGISCTDASHCWAVGDYIARAASGGTGSTDIGSTIYTGGAGATNQQSSSNGSLVGAGGGSSAGTAATGNAASTTTGGVAPTGGAAGGNGGSKAAGAAGAAPGGGGGGGGYDRGTIYNGGAGGSGQVKITPNSGVATTYTTGTATYTVGSGVTQLTIEAWGGGQGGEQAPGASTGGCASGGTGVHGGAILCLCGVCGGGGTTYYFSGAGGWGGDYVKRVITVSAGQQYAVTVGAGGAGDNGTGMGTGGDSYVTNTASPIIATSNGGSTWSAQSSGTTAALTSISCPAGQTNDCWAVTASGGIIATTNGGAAWTAQTSPTSYGWQAISCASTTQCWTVGITGTIAKTTNGTAWATQASPLTNNFYGLSCPSTSECWAVGVSGALIAGS